MGFGETQRNATHCYRMIQRSVLRLMAKLHVAFVQMPGDTSVSVENSANDKYSAFNGCISAIDGTYFAAILPLFQQRRFRSQKGVVYLPLSPLLRIRASGRQGVYWRCIPYRIASTKDSKIFQGRSSIPDAGILMHIYGPQTFEAAIRKRHLGILKSLVLAIRTSDASPVDPSAPAMWHAYEAATRANSGK
ncbi:hypothetical protein E4U57_007103 [Claviceps arundinis]|uniref:Uncharacterized protein n=1 Tax=Claviceps arundinis TaxID=1623583 RepID=A0A9P7MUJ7_9HYPO|nr:hypothetical protein E4U57_007103 [Claviceps arundinis]KAG5970169.1 hypothetical protein E4U56_007969 [Claviceps arundinis]